MKLRDLLKENDSYQLVLAQSANLEIPEDFEQLNTREYKDMLNKLHDLYGEGKYTKEPAHFLSTAIDYILDDPREDDLKTAHEFLHKHKNAAAKELSDKNTNMKLRDLLKENDIERLVRNFKDENYLPAMDDIDRKILIDMLEKHMDPKY